jgi:hypothetical protein
MKRLLFAFATLALVVASAKTYSVTLFQASTVAGKELKPGDYRLQVNGDKAVITNGSQSAESQVKVETGEAKYSSTSVRYANAEGKFRIQEIRLGGTKMKLVFD